jgi:antitoxin component YwqK of YwqJK toxin-antitoxin module
MFTFKALRKMGFPKGPIKGFEYSGFTGVPFAPVAGEKGDLENKEGLWLFSDIFGRIKVAEHYVNNVLHGDSMTYHYAEAGLAADVVKNTWNNGKKVEEVLFYHKSNKPRTRTAISNNQRDGPFFLFSRNGRILEKGRYKNGQRKGRWKTYFITGKLASIRRYKGGVLDGLQTDYYENGRPMVRITFRELRPRSRVSMPDGWAYEWDATGKLLSKWLFLKGKGHSVSNPRMKKPKRPELRYLPSL